MMSVSDLEVFFKHSPVVRLMRAENAPYIIAFLYEAFKERKVIELEQSELAAMLSEFTEDLEDQGVMQRQGGADEYISEWCGEGCRFLRRSLAVEKNVWLVQLQAETEEVLVFLEKIFEKQEGNFGTDSRMQLIVKSVKDLVLYSSGDVSGQLEQLEQEKRRIEEQIESIKRGDSSLELNEREVQERFQMIVSMLRDLTGDFRGVEQRFRDIVHGLREREQEYDGRTGDLLGYVLDAEDELRNNPHGASFYAFVDFVLSTDRRDEFEDMLVQLSSLSALMGSKSELGRLQDMLPLLTDEATKILQTTQRLSSALKRLLDPRASEEHRRLSKLMKETLRAASKLRAASNDESISMEVDVGLNLDSPMTRDFWKPAVKFKKTELREEVHEDEMKWKERALAEYAALKRLDWKLLESAVMKALKKKKEVGLKELVSNAELKAGLIEVLGYIQLAHDGGHVVDEAVEQTIRVAVEDGEYNITIPRVVFIRLRQDET